LAYAGASQRQWFSVEQARPANQPAPGEADTNPPEASVILDGRLTRITTPRRSYPDRAARQDVIAVIRPLPVSEVCFGGSDWELPRDSRSALAP